MSDIWDHYNARGLTPEMVAASFVAPLQFATIARPNNTVVLGARGSGKTTLLRMLEPRAQAAIAESTKKPPLSSVGVFVPIDASWLASLRQMCIDHSAHVDWNAAALCVYSMSVARAVVDVMIYRTKRESGAPTAYAVNLDRTDEERLSKEFSKILCLSELCFSFRDVRFRVTADLSTFPQRAARFSNDERRSFFTSLSDPVLIAATLCGLFNGLAEESDRRWALLCDEIEIAPPEVQEALFRALRATPAPLILKMSLTPVVHGFGKGLPEQPLPSHDYDVESLSYSTRGGLRSGVQRDRFCEAIWRGLVESRRDAQWLESPYKTLEDPNVSTVISRRGAAALSKVGSKGGDRYSQLFLELAKIDSSFAGYLHSKGVDPSALNSVSVGVRDAIVRKIAPLAEHRLFYKSGNSESGRSIAIRTSPVIFTGASRIFAMSEGHPRWLKSTLSAMLDSVGASRTISVPVQSNEIVHSVERLRSRIRAVPAQSGHLSSASTLLDLVGKFFAREVLGGVFKPDPYLSFIVDDEVASPVIRAIEDGLFIGALIPMSDEASGMLYEGVVGKRLRISYWLSPFYRLPLITGRPIALSRILNGDHLAEGRVDQLDLQI